MSQRLTPASLRGAVGSIQIRQQILRGVRASKILRLLGSLLRTSPDDLPPSARAGIWRNSKECTSIEAFVSQSWSSPWWQKFLALSMRFYWRPACALGGATTILCMTLDSLDYLPLVQPTNIERLGWDVSRGWTEPCPWGVVPPIATLTALFLAPNIQWLPNPVVFFDVACINQADEQLKIEGIYGLAGFLAKSEELIMLWSQSYFRRAWCVFELAVFVAIHGPDAVTCSPLFVSTGRCVGYIMSIAFCAVYSAADSASGVGGLRIVIWLLRFLIFVAWPCFLHRIRQDMAALTNLGQELERFTLDNVQCRLPEDLAFIKASIAFHWGGEEQFNQWVRRKLKATVGDSSEYFGYLDCLSITFPMACYSAQNLISFARAGATTSDMVFAILAHAPLVFIFLPNCVKLVFELCFRFAGPFNRQSVDVVVSIAIGVACTCYALGGVLMHMIVVHGLRWGWLLMIGIDALVFCVLFYRKKVASLPAQLGVAPSNIGREQGEQD